MNKSSKTREILINVARSLFAEHGVSNVTMNDIANASNKGRRTIYTYFNSKEEIYIAAIEKELDKTIEKLKAVEAKNINPRRKLIEYIFTRLDTMKELVTRNGNLKGDFFQDVATVEKCRKKIDIQELQIIKNILKEGVEKSYFHVENVDITAMMIHFGLRGIEIPYIKDNIREKLKNNRINITKFLLRGLSI